MAIRGYEAEQLIPVSFRAEGRNRVPIKGTSGGTSVLYLPESIANEILAQESIPSREIGELQQDIRAGVVPGINVAANPEGADQRVERHNKRAAQLAKKAQAEDTKLQELIKRIERTQAQMAASYNRERTQPQQQPFEPQGAAAEAPDEKALLAEYEDLLGKFNNPETRSKVEIRDLEKTREAYEQAQRSRIRSERNTANMKRENKEQREATIQGLEAQKQKFNAQAAMTPKQLAAIPENERVAWNPKDEQDLRELQSISTERKLVEEGETKRQEEARKALEAMKGMDASEEYLKSNPAWYAGKGGVLQQLFTRTLGETLEPLPIYPEERIAGLHTLQDVAKHSMLNAVQDPRLEQMGQAAMSNLQDIASSTAPNVAKEYMNPFQDQVLDALQSRATRRLKETILPKVRNEFMRGANYNSDKRLEAERKAIKDWDESLREQEGQILHQGYGQALNTAQEDMRRQAAQASELHNLKRAEQEAQFKNAKALDTLGERQRKIRQDQLTADYEDWLEQKNYQRAATNRLAEIANKAPVQSEVFQALKPQRRQSPYTPMAGAVGSLWGMSQAGNREEARKGGRIKKADGASIPSSGYENKLEQYINQMEGRKSNPWSNFFMRMGENISQSQDPSAWGTLARGVSAGAKGYQEGKMMDEAREFKTLDLRKALEESRAAAESRGLNNALKQAQLDQLKAPEETTERVAYPEEYAKTGKALITRMQGKKHLGTYSIPIQEGGVEREPSSGNSLLNKFAPKGSTPQEVVLEGEEEKAAAPRGFANPYEERKATEEKLKNDQLYEDKAIKAAEGINRIKDIKNLSKELYTPQWQKVEEKYLAPIKGIAGNESKPLANIEQFNSMVAREYPAAIETLRGFGSMSEKEQEAVLAPLPKALMQPSARKYVIDVLEAAHKTNHDQVLARDFYIRKHGTDQGFKVEWSKYLKKYPHGYYDSLANVWRVNPANIDKWKEYFGEKTATKEDKGAAPNLETKVETSKGKRTLAQLLEIVEKNKKKK